MDIFFTPLNWQATVKEALQRRNDKEMTQRQHAELANVSVPTMAAFDRGEMTLSVSKVYDILRIVNLIESPSILSATATAQNIFVEKYLKYLTKEIENPYGAACFDYYFEGDLKEPMNPKPLTIPYSFYNFDYKERRMVLVHGYKEDTDEIALMFNDVKTLFDTALPLWNMAETLLHAESMAKQFKKEDTEITVHFRALYWGLRGRILCSRAIPDHKELYRIERHKAYEDKALLNLTVPSHTISKDLVEHLYLLAKQLYSAFRIKDFPKEVVELVVKRVLEKKR